jgi:hypothetical protein
MSTLLLKDLVAIQGSYISAVDIAGTYEKAFENPDGMLASGLNSTLTIA